MKNFECKDYTQSDEVRTFENGKLELLNFGGQSVGRFTLQPGWQWSKHVKPIAGTEMCQAPHFGYTVSGRLRWKLKDGTEFETHPGQIVNIQEPHDAWVVGSEPWVAVDWAGATNYAKQQ